MNIKNLSALIISIILSGCTSEAYESCQTVTITKVLDCTETTDSFLTGRKEGLCRVQFSNGKRSDVSRPVAIDDVYDICHMNYDPAYKGTTFFNIDNYNYKLRK